MANQSTGTSSAANHIQCYHCGEDCGSNPVLFDERSFCCTGCKTVYEILSNSNACDFYTLENHPGKRAIANEIGERYAWLDNPDISRDLLEFSEDGISKVRLFIPVIHCSSCIWLLENIHRFNPGILYSSVNFLKKEVTITFRDGDISFRQLVELLVSINYIPHLGLDSLKEAQKKKIDRGIYYRLGVAGFCFGNIMLFSFPAYLSVDDSIEQILRQNFGLLNILLGIPVAFFSGSGYFVSAYKGLRKRYISIDVPIAVGITVLFFRSVYEILSGTGPGFMDSLAGLVFFLLVGKWYQGKTYEALSFERDYRSYFPVAVTIITDEGMEKIIALKDLKTGMRILIRNQELIPADSLLVKGNASIDYSFVTGESTPVSRSSGERVFAGGRQIGTMIEMIVEKEVTQSRLTELWNQDPSGREKETKWHLLVDIIGRNFTVALMTVALITGIAWWFIDPSRIAFVVTSILIVACPCALALSLPFSFGGAMRALGRNGFYMKSTSVIELLAKVDTIVFDKTGTLTKSDDFDADLSSLKVSPKEIAMIRSAVRNSTHPASVALYRIWPEAEMAELSGFREIPAKGIEGLIGTGRIKIGNEEFVTGQRTDTSPGLRVFISINDQQKGYVLLRNRYREGMGEVFKALENRFEIHLLSGDQDSERSALEKFFSSPEKMHFNQSPTDKLNYIRKLKAQGKKVLMVGDGLNDAGALKESDCGVSIADDVYLFSPSCDAILESKQFRHMGDYLRFTRDSIRIVKMSMGFSLMYNLAGLSFAVTGNLTPVVSAILMPLSSVTVVGFITLAVHLAWLRVRSNAGK